MSHAGLSEKTYGVRERSPEPKDDIGVASEMLQSRGFAVVPNAFSSEQVGQLNERLEEVYARQCAEVGGEEALFKISDADIVRCPLAYDDTFLDVALHPVIVGTARRMIGPSVVLLMQNGIINRPDRTQAQTAWHRDLNYQHWVSSRPIAISAMVCLEDFTEETGGTVFLAGSHKIEPMPSETILRSASETPRASAGSIVLFDSMVFHRAGINRSKLVRRGINHVVGAPILAQTIDIPRMMSNNAPADPLTADYLGFRWNPFASVANWRRNKITSLANA
jgi:ectoine hydroxylase-related dioxygenase (phytanoyl-CoA dioxygenase family)